MLKLTNVSVSFGKNQVLRNLSCEVEQGDFIVIVGTNGAGKSTFFDTIAGKISPDVGTIMLEQQDITRMSEQQRSAVVGRIFQNAHLNVVGSLTVAQNLALACYAHRPVQCVDGMRNMSHDTAAALLQRVGLPASLLDKQARVLSGGQKQLLAFVMTTLRTPKILLLDEPTAALDPQAATSLLYHATRYIKQHGITTLLITHDPHIALSVGNKVWVLENGAIAKQYSSKEKCYLRPDQLVGQIDYARIASL